MQCSFLLSGIIKISVSSYPKRYLLPMAAAGLYIIPCKPAHLLPVLSGWGIGTWGLMMHWSFLVIGNKGIRLERPAGPSACLMRQQKLGEQIYETWLSHFTDSALHWWATLPAAGFLGLTSWITLSLSMHEVQPCSGPRSQHPQQPFPHSDPFS